MSGVLNESAVVVLRTIFFFPFDRLSFFFYTLRVMLRSLLFQKTHSTFKPTLVLCRWLQLDSKPKKGYTNIRKGNDLSTANYYFENGNYYFPVI